MQTTARRALDVLLEKYAESHRHPLNEIIHCICVPAIVFSLLGMLWAVHPLVAVTIMAMSLLYYLMLSPAYALAMLVMLALSAALLQAIPAHRLLAVSAAVFVLAWIGQFIGHKIEGRKPSFFDDVRFLLIGPLFVLDVLRRRIGN